MALPFLLLAASARAASSAAPLTADLTTALAPVAPVPNMGPSVAPDGRSLSVDTGGFRIDGVPFLDISGEIHYARVPRAAWPERLRRLRAGGLTTVASYVFWTHHEEVEGAFVWTGQRDLRAFVQEAQRAGLLISLRIGPYGHGEVRGGGLPDWIQQVPGISVRSTQPLFMSYAQKLYDQIAAQLAGLYWSDGGPIITLQLDNEESNAAYLMALRSAAVASNMTPPFFVATGNNTVPKGSMLPFSGRYVAPFWDCTNAASANYLFREPDYLGSGYPTLFCELGSGMAAVYSCRHNMDAADLGAAALVTLAATNGLGYYMFGGGLNPRGILTTLQERQGDPSCPCYSGDWALPVINYDFVAPLSQSGSLHGQFHLLRMLHSLAADPALAAWLPPSASFLPDVQPVGPDDTTTLRWQARGDGATSSALLFFNNYVRGLAMSNHSGVRLQLTLPARAQPLVVPAAASPGFDVPSGAFFVWPVYPPLVPSASGLALVYALAQLLGTIETPGGPVLLFAATAGVVVEFCFDDAAGLTVLQCAGTCTVEGTSLFARAVPAGRGAALTLRVGSALTSVTILVVDQASGSERVWFGSLAGQRRAFIGTAADASSIVEFDSEGAPLLRLVSDGNEAAISILPAPASLTPAAGGPPIVGTADGIFTRFSVALPPPAVSVSASLSAPAGVPPPVSKGSRGNAMGPGADGSLAGWDSAGVWSLTFDPPGFVADNATELILVVDFVGDAGRVLTNASNSAGYADLLNDAWFNAPATAAQQWETPLTSLLGPAMPPELTLRLLALREDAKADVGLDVWPAPGSGPSGPGINTCLELRNVRLVRRVTVALVAAA